MRIARIAPALVACLCLSGCVDGPKWEQTMRQARSQMQGGDYASAERSLLDALDQAQRLHPLHPYQLETNTELARLYFKTGEYERGKTALSRVITKLEVLQSDEDPGLARLYSERGRVSDLLGQLDEAHADYARALPVALEAPLENRLDYLYLDMAVNAAHRKQPAEADEYFANATKAAQVLHPGGSIFEEIQQKRAETGRN